MKICPKCGKEMSSNTFCSECGAYVERTGMDSVQSPSVLGLVLDKVFPWFWPSALKADSFEDNNFLRLLEEVRPNRKIIAKLTREFTLYSALMGVYFGVMLLRLFDFTDWWWAIPVALVFGALSGWGLWKLTRFLISRDHPRCLELMSQTPETAENLFWGLAMRRYPRPMSPKPIRRWVVGYMLILSVLYLLAGIAGELLLTLDPWVPPWFMVLEMLPLLAILPPMFFIAGVFRSLSQEKKMDWMRQVLAGFSIFPLALLCLPMSMMVEGFPAMLRVLLLIPASWFCLHVIERQPVIEIQNKLSAEK